MMNAKRKVVTKEQFAEGYVHLSGDVGGDPLYTKYTRHSFVKIAELPDGTVVVEDPEGEEIPPKKGGCMGCKRPELGYMEWHADAERRRRAGERQVRCPDCGLWTWPEHLTGRAG